MPSYQPGPAFSVTSPFGNRNGEFHPGLDFAAPAGTPVPAASDGTVVYSGYNQGPQGSDRGGYGYTVIIRSTGADGSTYYTLYAHMQPSDLPEVGKQVASSDIIGNVGNTGFVEGNNFGTHLHFEVLNGDAPVANTDGGPVGFSSTNRAIREDPNTFDQWNAGTPFQGGLNTSSSGGGELGDIASSDGSLGEQRVVATANGVEVETLTINSDGSQTENFQSLNADGSAQFTLTTSIPTGVTPTDQFTIGTVLDANLNV